METAESGFTRGREDARVVENYLNPLSRSVARASEYTLLDGIWRFEHDPFDVGLRERWYDGRGLATTAHWPGSVEEHLAAAQMDQQKDRAWKDSVVVWYEREFDLPKRWSEMAASIVQLTFGACGVPP